MEKGQFERQQRTRAPTHLQFRNYYVRQNACITTHLLARINNHTSSELYVTTKTIIKTTQYHVVVFLVDYEY